MKVIATLIQTNRVIYTLKINTGNETTPSQVTGNHIETPCLFDRRVFRNNRTD